MYSNFGQFIDGQWQQAEKKETYKVINPATEEVLDSIQSSMEAKEITELSKKEGLDADVFGPLAFDNSVSKKSAAIKGIKNLMKNYHEIEKKRNEILQMALLEPKIAILDETDSGLDIDALRIVASGIKKISNAQTGIILITHYQRLLDEIKPNYVHVMSDGKIIKTGESDLALELEKKGYEWTDNFIKET